MKNIILNNIEYRQTTTCPKVYIAKDGSYILPNGNDPQKVRYGTKAYNKNGYPLQVMICTTVDVIVNGKTAAKRIVKNAGRLVLDAWKNEIDETMEVDHIDRNPFNNNLDNLRLVTKIQNMHNRIMTKNPTWLHTPEVAKKRLETKNAKKNGTYVEPVKKRITHKISYINSKIDLLRQKALQWNHNKGKNYENAIKKIQNLEEELLKLEQKVPVYEIIK